MSNTIFYKWRKHVHICSAADVVNYEILVVYIFKMDSLFLQALKELILDGVEEKYDDLRREIKLKEEEIEDIKHSSIQNILDIASNILTESLPVLCNIGMQILSSYVLG